MNKKQSKKKDKTEPYYIKKYEALYKYSKEMISDESMRKIRVEEKAIKYLTAMNILLIFLLFFFKEIINIEYRFFCIYIIEIIIIFSLLIMILISILLIIYTIDLSSYNIYSLEDTFECFEEYDYDEVLYRLSKDLKKTHNEFMKITDKKVNILKISICFLKISIITLICLLFLHFFNIVI